MKISVNTQGLAEMKLRLAGLERKIKVATKAALNDAAFIGAKKTAEKVAAVFDRPTPWVRGSVRYKKATADKLEASIDFDKWGNKTGVTVEHVLRAEIFGGRRRLKRHEVALQRSGVLPQGWAIVPGEAADMDQFGNMSAGQIRQILSWFNAAKMTSGHDGNMTDKTRKSRRLGTRSSAGFEYFVVPVGARRTWQRGNGKTGSHAMQPGIYKRFFLGHGTAIKPIMIFVKIPTYSKRLDFYEIVQRSSIPEFERAFNRYAEQFIKERSI